MSRIRPVHFEAYAGAGLLGGAGEPEIALIVDTVLTIAADTQKA
jgi:hypothetical protein